MKVLSRFVFGKRAVTTFVSFKWLSPTYRTVFTAEHVNVHAAMVRRHYPAKHRYVCITDNPIGLDVESFPLWRDHENLQNPSGFNLPSCYRRLRIFDPETQKSMGIEEGERIFCMDLDIVIVADIRPLLRLDETADFIGWQGIGSYRPVVYNGSLYMLRAGRLAWMWDEFDPVESPAQTRRANYFGSDQAWMSYKLDGKAPGWDVQHGVYSYARDIRQRPLPSNARIVCFNGKWKPWDSFVQHEAPWVSKHWRM